MRFIADLHIHSYLSRATSQNLNLEQLHRWAQLKGITVVATGDFTHPRWFAELREKLVPAEPGLFALRSDLANAVDAEVPAACRAPVRFMLSVETSSIYKRGGKVRKVHNLIYTPDFESAARVSTRLARIGNIESDGRPILGLDSRDLLEIVLESSRDGYLVPAHIWTPWFSALGAQSGFDAVDECFADLAPHIFAIETGLSSDPSMNWRLSALDRFALVSNSDAHSPEKLGREANRFDCALSYFTMREAWRSRSEGFLGTIEFFPEEGKYHYDGHRKCGVVLFPEEAGAAGGRCPQCGQPLTRGVMGRVVELADRPAGARPAGAKPFQSLVPLGEVLGEVLGAGSGSVRVRQVYERLLSSIGPEIALLSDAPVEDLVRQGPPLLGEAVKRIREGQVHRRPGYDGEYGGVHAFDGEERRKLLSQTLFAFGEVSSPTRSPKRSSTPSEPALTSAPPPRSSVAQPLPNPRQVLAIQHGRGPLLLIAGPGTGKTWTVVQRIAHLMHMGWATPGAITVITFTRKAAMELKERLRAKLPAERAPIRAATFHAFGLELLRAFSESAGLPRGFTVLDEAARWRMIESARAEVLKPVPTSGRLAERIGWAKAHLRSPSETEPDVAPAYGAYQRALETAGALDFDDLVLRAVRLLDSNAEALNFARECCQWLFVDEYQDINAAQYQMVRLLAPAGANFCAVGDPDQAIYGFRGSDPAYFVRFQQDYPDAIEIALTQNYRSTASVVNAATAVIEPSAGRRARPLEPLDHTTGSIERCLVANEREEATLIAAEIGYALGGTRMEAVPSGGGNGLARPLALHDVAVLVRTSAQMEVMAEALTRANLPFHRVGEDPLTARPRVAQLLSQLRALLEKAGEPGPLVELARDVGRRSVSDLVVRLGAMGEDAAPWRAAVDLCAALAAPFGQDVGAFLRTLPLLHEMDLELETQKVALLTLHAAKGLEFPLVFIAGCEDGLLPLRLFGGPSDVEEERRLLYVGMTRAKERLVLTAARTRSLLGRSLENGPCPFLEYLPPHLLADRRVPARRRRGHQLSFW